MPVGKEDTNDIHPDDPTNPVPKIQSEFKHRVIKGPYQPEFTSYPRSVFGNRHRSFQKSWHMVYFWLEYSPKKDAAYCLPCRMFCGSVGLNVGQFEVVFFKNWVYKLESSYRKVSNSRTIKMSP